MTQEPTPEQLEKRHHSFTEIAATYLIRYFNGDRIGAAALLEAATDVEDLKLLCAYLAHEVQFGTWSSYLGTDEKTAREESDVPLRTYSEMEASLVRGGGGLDLRI